MVHAKINTKFWKKIIILLWLTGYFNIVCILSQRDIQNTGYNSTTQHSEKPQIYQKQSA